MFTHCFPVVLELSVAPSQFPYFSELLEVLRAIIRQSEAKLEMKNVLCGGRLPGGWTKTAIFGSAAVSLPW